MTIKSLFGLIALAGAVGGMLNALMATGGLVFPRVEELGKGGKQLSLGFLGNVIVGAGAALILGFFCTVRLVT